MVQVFADLSAMQDGILSIGGNDYNKKGAENIFLRSFPFQRVR